jgi:hypothetical protein
MLHIIDQRREPLRVLLRVPYPTWEQSITLTVKMQVAW